MDNSLQHLNNGFNEKNTTCKRIHQQTEEIFFLIRYNGSMPLNGHLYMNIECTQTYCNPSFIHKHRCLKLYRQIKA